MTYGNQFPRLQGSWARTWSVAYVFAIAASLPQLAERSPVACEEKIYLAIARSGRRSARARSSAPFQAGKAELRGHGQGGRLPMRVVAHIGGFPSPDRFAGIELHGGEACRKNAEAFVFTFA